MKISQPVEYTAHGQTLRIARVTRTVHTLRVEGQPGERLVRYVGEMYPVIAHFKATGALLREGERWSTPINPQRLGETRREFKAREAGEIAARAAEYLATTTR